MVTALFFSKSLLIYCRLSQFSKSRSLQVLQSKVHLYLLCFGKIRKKVFFIWLPRSPFPVISLFCSAAPALSNTLSDTFRNFGGFCVIKISVGKTRGYCSGWGAPDGGDSGLAGV